MRLFSHPFRLSPNGAVATVEQGSEQASAEQIAMYVLTRKGERSMLPAFGIEDPTFQTLDTADVTLGIGLYVPEVTAVDVTTKTTNESVEVEVKFANEQS